MSKKAKIWTITVSVFLLVSITLTLGITAFFFPVISDEVTLSQLRTRINKGNCIVPKEVDEYDLECATIEFVFDGGGAGGENYKAFNYSTLMGYVVEEDELVLKERYVYKNKKQTNKTGITPWLSYNRAGYNTSSNGYIMQVSKDVGGEVNKEKTVYATIAVNKPSEFYRQGSGVVNYYTFGTKTEYKGVDIYYKLANAEFNNNDLGLCFAFGQVVYCIRVYGEWKEHTGKDYFQSIEQTKEVATEVVDWFIK